MESKNDGSKTFWFKFIGLYHAFPELWKVKSEVCKNRIKKYVVYKKLNEKMKEINLRANKDLVRSIIDSFCTSYSLLSFPLNKYSLPQHKYHRCQTYSCKNVECTLPYTSTRSKFKLKLEQAIGMCGSEVCVNIMFAQTLTLRKFV